MASFTQPSFDWNANRETEVDRFKRHVDLMLSFNRNEFITESSKIEYIIIILGTRGVAFYYSTWDTKKYPTHLESFWLAFRNSMAPTTSVTPQPSHTTSVTPQPSPTTSVTPQPSPTTSVTPHPSPTTSVMLQPLPLRTKPVTPLPSLAKSVIPSQPYTTHVLPSPWPTPTSYPGTSLKRDVLHYYWRKRDVILIRHPHV